MIEWHVNEVLFVKKGDDITNKFPNSLTGKKRGKLLCKETSALMVS